MDGRRGRELVASIGIVSRMSGDTSKVGEFSHQVGLVFQTVVVTLVDPGRKYILDDVKYILDAVQMGRSPLKLFFPWLHRVVLDKEYLACQCLIREVRQSKPSA